MRGAVRIAFGTAVATACALVLAHVFAGNARSAVVPIVFVVVIFFLALRYGWAVGVMSSLAAAVVFAHMLFNPLENWHVADLVARQNLAWMVLGGVSLSYLFAPGLKKSAKSSSGLGSPRAHNKRSGGQNSTFNSREK